LYVLRRLIHQVPPASWQENRLHSPQYSDFIVHRKVALRYHSR
jgi:hypothetical protein